MLLDAHTADEQLNPAAPLAMLLDHFDLIVQTPADVDKLDAAILQLSVEGKLVAQDLRDESTAEMLNRIDISKAEFVEKEGLREKEQLPELTSEEIPFTIPSSWLWCRLGRCTYIKRGASPRPKGNPEYYAQERTPFHWIKISDIQKHSDGFTLTDTEEFLTEAGMQKSVFLPTGTLILTNSATIGVPIFLGINGCIHDGYLAFPFTGDGEIMPKYLYYYLLNIKGLIRKHARGLAQLNLNTSIVNNLPFPLPPLAEQKRIVARVDELRRHTAALRTELAAAAQDAVTVNNAALNRLHTAEHADAFAAAWQTLRHAFDPLYSVPQNLTALRQTILQLAVQGKLVPQDPHDEPATELIKRIEAEKQKLIDAKLIRKTNEFVPTRVPDSIASIPSNWQLCHADSLFQFVTSGSRGWAKYYSDEGPVFLRIGNLDYGTTKLDLSNIQRVTPPEGAEGSRTRTESGDILISITGDTGMVGLVPSGFEEAYINQHIAMCRPVTSDIGQYLALVLTSAVVLEQLWDSQRGIKNSLGLDDIRRLWIPLPPLAEQERIVAKVDELLALCDVLEAELAEAEAVRVRLVDAVLAEV